MQSEYGQLTTEVKRKILGLNAAKLYDIEVPEGLGETAAPADSGQAVGSAPKVPAGQSA
jgi:hypothetical protein